MSGPKKFEFKPFHYMEPPDPAWFEKEEEGDPPKERESYKTPAEVQMYDPKTGKKSVYHTGDETPIQRKPFCNALACFTTAAALAAYIAWYNSQPTDSLGGKSKRNKGKSIKRKGKGKRNINRKPKTKTIKKRRITL